MKYRYPLFEKKGQQGSSADFPFRHDGLTVELSVKFVAGEDGSSIALTDINHTAHPQHKR